MLACWQAQEEHSSKPKAIPITSRYVTSSKASTICIDCMASHVQEKLHVQILKKF
jgi:hypothetical protein